MVDYIEMVKLDDIQSGQMRMFEVESRQVLLARVGDTIYAANNICPHMGGNLSMGKLEGTMVTCPRHHSQFDLTDGHVIRWTDWTGIKLNLGKVVRPPRPLETYRTRIENGRILVESPRVPAEVNS